MGETPMPPYSATQEVAFGHSNETEYTMNQYNKSHTLFILASFSIAVIFISGCQQHNPIAKFTTQQVSIDNFTFSPPTITVPAGTTVTWTNHDDVPHTVTADDKLFHSSALDTDDHYTHLFDVPGNYPYFCAVHPHMTGRIIVK